MQHRLIFLLHAAASLLQKLCRDVRVGRERERERGGSLCHYAPLQLPYKLPGANPPSPLTPKPPPPHPPHPPHPPGDPRRWQQSFSYPISNLGQFVNKLVSNILVKFTLEMVNIFFFGGGWGGSSA